MVVLGVCWGEMLRWEGTDPCAGGNGESSPKESASESVLFWARSCPPAGAKQSPRHERRAMRMKASRDPLGGSLAVCKSWLILLLLLAVEGFSGINDEKKIHLPDLTHLSVLFPQG